MTIYYDPQSLLVSFLFRWRGTIFPLVLSDPLFWFLSTVHVVLIVVHKSLLAQNVRSHTLQPTHA